MIDGFPPNKREAWGLLTANQQDKANKKAQEAIDYWRNKKCQRPN